MISREAERAVQHCPTCIFRNLDCRGSEAEFILEVLCRAHAGIGPRDFCPLFNASRIESFRLLRERKDRAACRRGGG